MMKSELFFVFLFHLFTIYFLLVSKKNHSFKQKQKISFKKNNQFTSTRSLTLISFELLFVPFRHEIHLYLNLKDYHLKLQKFFSAYTTALSV
jgi:hypothetical protein